MAKPITCVTGYRVEGSVFFNVRDGEAEFQVLAQELLAESAEHLVLARAGVVEQLLVESGPIFPAEVVEHRCGDRKSSGSNEGVGVLRHESGPFKEG